MKIAICRSPERLRQRNSRRSRRRRDDPLRSPPADRDQENAPVGPPVSRIGQVGFDRTRDRTTPPLRSSTRWPRGRSGHRDERSPVSSELRPMWVNLRSVCTGARAPGEVSMRGNDHSDQPLAEPRPERATRSANELRCSGSDRELASRAGAGTRASICPMAGVGARPRSSSVLRSALSGAIYLIAYQPRWPRRTSLTCCRKTSPAVRDLRRSSRRA